MKTYEQVSSSVLGTLGTILSVQDLTQIVNLVLLILSIVNILWVLYSRIKEHIIKKQTDKIKEDIDDAIKEIENLKGGKKDE